MLIRRQLSPLNAVNGAPKTGNGGWTMTDQDLKQLVTQGLGAQKAGSRIAASAIDDVIKDATHPKLKEALEQGKKTSMQWASRIDAALQEVAGQGDAAAGDNPIITAHGEVARRIRSEAKSDTARDLGIVAAGQLALHYWIAAFGTMHAYGEKLGMTTMADAMGKCVAEARQADEAQTQIAKVLMAA